MLRDVLSQKLQQCKRNMSIFSIFDNTFEMVWVFYSGITGFKSIEIKSILSDAIATSREITEAMIKNKCINVSSKVLVKNHNAHAAHCTDIK